MDIGRELIIFNFQFSIFNKFYRYTLRPLYSRRRGGYTLLELLMSIGIVIILASVTIPGFGSKKTVNELNNIALDFQSKLKLAQSYALSPPTDNQGSVAYGVKVVDDGLKMSYNIVRLRSGSSEDYPQNSKFTSDSVKISSTIPENTTTVWYNIGTTVRIETNESSALPEKIAFTFKLRKGSPSEVRIVSINSATGTINAK